MTDSILKTHNIHFCNADFTAIQVAELALAVQGEIDSVEVSKDSFGQQFILLAATCSNPENFLKVMGAIEAEMSWKSKQNPDGEKKAPAVWNQTKSNMKCAWEKFGITPQMVKTTAELNEKLNEARKDAKEAKESEATQAENSETATQAIVTADQVDKSFSNLLVKLVEDYNELEEQDRALMLEGLTELHNTFHNTAVDGEIKELIETLPENDSQQVAH